MEKSHHNCLGKVSPLKFLEGPTSTKINPTTSQHSTMLSRTIFHASKSSIRAPRTQLQKSFSSFTRPSAFPISRSAAPPLSTRLSPRWYSDAAETKPADKSEASTKDEAASPPVAEIEALKKDVEAKNKEIIDLKVSTVVQKTLWIYNSGD